MKKLIALITLVSMQATPAMAWIGGPWSGNTWDGQTTGLFGGTITMKNGSGIFRFTSTETAQMGTYSSSMIYYKGITFFGSCQANIDFEAKTVDGMTNGSAFNRNPGPAQNRTSPIVDNNPNFAPGSTGSNQSFTIPLVPNIVDGEPTPNNFQLTNVGTSGPVGIANTTWSGRLTTTKPNVRFRAKGEANFLGPQKIVQRITVRYGEPVIPRTPSDPSLPVETFIPGPPEEVSVDRGGNDPFPEPTNRVKLRVFGSRISYNLFVPTGGTNGTVEGTGGGGFAF
ncbi:MAG: hypothetical protein ACKV19_04255 [Verrucomicrobiales bacterium]